MGKPSAAAASDGGDASEQEHVATPHEATRAGFVAVQALSKQWLEKEREGISLIESFQTALLATRAEASRDSGVRKATQTSRVMDTFAVDEADSSAALMDPWLAEDLYAQIKELPVSFTELLKHLYEILGGVQEKLRAEPSDAAASDARALSTADYVQFIANEVATFEAEFQHIEALLAMISFNITTNQLRTLVISWSTSPFLDLERSREFRQRHELSQKVRS